MAKVIAVIGAGAAGIAAGRRLLENNLEFEIFEQSDSIGGTWVYDERIGYNEYGLLIHTSMYENLRTNLPKEIMGFPDFPINDREGRSYIPSEGILEFLRSYAYHYKVVPHIKLNTHVMQVEKVGEKWKVTSKYLPNGTINRKLYDAVMVCNGHYHTPWIPYIPGIEKFTGLAMHSHDYRRSSDFKGLSIVVVGAGPSGIDIAKDLTKTAKVVHLSHHSKDEITTVFPPNFVMKPDIAEIDGPIVRFTNNSEAVVDILLYCTGYQYNFPFLHQNCGVNVFENRISPLYKHLISINNPTLCFVGLPFYVCANAMFDLQVRFFIKAFKGEFQLPTKEEMLADERADLEMRQALGFSSRETHKMGPLQGQYYEDLANTANIEGLGPVMATLHNESSRRFLEDHNSFREDRYRILNDVEYLQGTDNDDLANIKWMTANLKGIKPEMISLYNERRFGMQVIFGRPQNSYRYELLTRSSAFKSYDYVEGVFQFFLG